ELDFIYEGLQNQNLINWEKMHLAAKILRSFRLAKGNNNIEDLFEIYNELTFNDEKLIYNLYTELDFIYEGLQNQNLINWEKMHLAAKILKSFRLAKGNNNVEDLFEIYNELTFNDEKLIYNLYTVNSPSLLMNLSSEIQKKEENEFEQLC
uniref:Uncharacterized protein n=1 Tax=Meloidogyne floridensis TaxID=298350 RepID=A0A915NJF7_9BILA